MEVNWIIICIVAMGAVALLWFLIRRNRNDEKNLEDFLNKNDHKVKKNDDEFNDER